MKVKDYERISLQKMKVKRSFKFGEISQGGYKHYPIIYFAHGTDGFLITVFGFTLTVKL